MSDIDDLLDYAREGIALSILGQKTLAAEVERLRSELAGERERRESAERVVDRASRHASSSGHLLLSNACAEHRSKYAGKGGGA